MKELDKSSCFDCVFLQSAFRSTFTTNQPLRKSSAPTQAQVKVQDSRTRDLLVSGNQVQDLYRNPWSKIQASGKDFLFCCLLLGALFTNLSSARLRTSCQELGSSLGDSLDGSDKGSCVASPSLKSALWSAFATNQPFWRKTGGTQSQVKNQDSGLWDLQMLFWTPFGFLGTLRKFSLLQSTHQSTLFKPTFFSEDLFWMVSLFGFLLFLKSVLLGTSFYHLVCRKRRRVSFSLAGLMGDCFLLTSFGIWTFGQCVVFPLPSWCQAGRGLLSFNSLSSSV